MIQKKASERGCARRMRLWRYGSLIKPLHQADLAHEDPPARQSKTAIQSTAFVAVAPGTLPLGKAITINLTDAHWVKHKNLPLFLLGEMLRARSNGDAVGSQARRRNSGGILRLHPLPLSCLQPAWRPKLSRCRWRALLPQDCPRLESVLPMVL